jgi:DNA-binding NarL/FixJ family response regulator
MVIPLPKAMFHRILRKLDAPSRAAAIMRTIPHGEQQDG